MLENTWITPPPLLPSFKAKKSSGNPIAFPNQSVTIVSNSAHAGDAACKFKLNLDVFDL
jgi:hypothetical protein